MKRPSWQSWGRGDAVKVGYQFTYTRCPICGLHMAQNWLVRHMKKEHPQQEGDKMSRQDYKALIELGITNPAAWAEAARANPTNPQTALAEAVKADPWATAGLLLAFAKRVAFERGDLDK